jgi:hypothetical protein
MFDVDRKSKKSNLEGEQTKVLIDIQVRPSEGWGEARPVDIGAVCESVAQCFAPAVHEKDIEPIDVVYDETGPWVLHERVNGRIQVLLAARGRDWCRVALQFAHELTHVLSNFRPPEQHPTAWIEESLSDVGTSYALRRMAVTWLTSAPYSNWCPYARSLSEYITARLGEPARQLPEHTSFRTWLQQRIAMLSANAYRREDNTIVAVALLPIFETTNGEAWRAVRYIELVDGIAATPQHFLEQWRALTPAHLRVHVDAIEKVLLG